MYAPRFSKKFEKQLKKVPKKEQKKILEKIKASLENPRAHAAKLESVRPAMYRMRAGDYRVFMAIDDALKLVIIGEVHRRTTQTYR